MTRAKVIDHSTLLSLLDYDADTGIFTWKMCVGARRMKVGSRAGSLNTSGHRQIMIFGKMYLASRLAWFYVKGEWPADQLDHINRVRDDNRFSNFRLATLKENTWNSGARKSISGLKGAHYDKSRRGKKWVAALFSNGKRKCLGLFHTAEEAHAEYVRVSKLTHGDFSFAVSGSLAAPKTVISAPLPPVTR